MIETIEIVLLSGVAALLWVVVFAFGYAVYRQIKSK